MNGEMELDAQVRGWRVLHAIGLQSYAPAIAWQLRYLA